MEVETFINKNLNYTYKLYDILKILLKNTLSDIGFIFCNFKYTHFKCLYYIGLNNEPILTVEHIKNILYNDFSGVKLNDYDTSSNESVLIPIFENELCLGVLGLSVKKKNYKAAPLRGSAAQQAVEYNEDIIKIISPYLGLIQLLLKNKILTDQNESLDTNNFIACMSHELRTPLNGICGFNQLLSKTVLNSKQAEFVAKISNCSVQLLRIINDILDYFKLTSGHLNINNEPFEIRNMFQIIKDTVFTNLTSKNQKLNIYIHKDVPNIVICDRQKIIQIIINLLSNAIKFSDNGKQIDIEVKKSHTNIIIEIIDRGIGIHSKNIKRIFEAFEQIPQPSEFSGGSRAERSSANNFHSEERFNQKKSSGLGLFISKKLANLINGDILVKSEYKKGSTFTLIFKFNNYKYNNHKYQNLSFIKEKTVLVFDSDIKNRIYLCEMLFELKIKPIICASLIEAQKMIVSDTYKFDLCIIRSNLDGNKLLKQIQEERPLLPCIGICQNKEVEDNSKFDNLLEIPFKISCLISKLKIILKNGNLTNKPIKTIRNHRILIADDISYNSNLLKNMLEYLGFENIDISHNGKDAIDKIVTSQNEKNPYQCILLDLKMPVLNGFDVIEKYNYEGWTLPKIIVVTASVMSKDRERCKKLNVKYFINKPVDLDELSKILNYVLF